MMTLTLRLTFVRKLGKFIEKYQQHRITNKSVNIEEKRWTRNKKKSIVDWFSTDL